MPLRPRPYRDSILADLPQFYWRLSGNVSPVIDQSPFNNNLAVNAGGPGILRDQPGLLPAVVGTSMYFDGLAGWCSGPDVDFAAAMTIEAWAAADTPVAGDHRKVMGKNTGAADMQGALGNDTGRPFYEWNAGAVYGSYLHTAPLVHREGTYMALTLDGVRAKAYYKGLLVNDVAAAGVLATNNVSWDVGATNGAGPVNFWKGWIQEVAGYPSALPAYKIVYHYLLGIKVFRQKSPRDEETLASQLLAFADALQEEERQIAGAGKALAARGIDATHLHGIVKPASDGGPTAYQQQLAQEVFGVEDFSQVTQEMKDAWTAEERANTFDNGPALTQEELDAAHGFSQIDYGGYEDA